MIDNLAPNTSKLKILERSLISNEKVSVFGCGFGEKMALMLESINKIVLVVANEEEAYRFANEFEQNNMRVVVLAKPFNLDLEKIGNESDFCSKLIKLTHGNFDVLILTGETFIEKYPKPKLFKNSISLNVGDDCDIYKLADQLITLNYSRVDVVQDRGEFSLRGDVLDIFPNEFQFPLRLLFDFGSLEKIKKISTSNLMLENYEKNSIEIFSNNYLSINKNKLIEILNKNKKVNAELKEKMEVALNLVEQNSFLSNYWFSAFDENFNATILDYVEDFTLYILDAKSVFDNAQQRIKQKNLLIQEGILNNQLLSEHRNLKLSENSLNLEDLKCAVLCFQHISNSNRFFKPNKIFNFNCAPIPNYSTNKKVLFLDLKTNLENGITTVLCCKSKESLDRLERELNSSKINHEIVSNLKQVAKQSINLIVKNYYNSFFFYDEKICVVGIKSLFGYKKAQKIQSDINFEDVFIPRDGDYVVHKVHGIGRCLGLKSFDVGGVKKDYFVVEYKNCDKLFVPCENVDSIAKYVGQDGEPKLNKIGGTEFAKIRQNVKQKVKEMAFSLIQLYAKRQELRGFEYPKDDELQEAFENSFEYNETLDQLNALADIKRDMESGKVMDRLVCGDVGFGKTEVAIRCAFKTICAGKMVAFLCPTTILSEQHYNTCMLRMAKFGVRIEVLNRFKTEKEIKRILELLEKGEIDIIIGTHKLLGKRVEFKNLGLLILDEEQKFGVEDKEKIKNLKKDVNILTLSATPIPRTLNMSLSGIRDISVIQTPPTSRLPVEVYVVEFNIDMVKNAILREISNSGQVLIVYNRVESIYAFASKIKEAISDSNISVSVAHGQMQEKELENEIMKLYNQETQVLISTTLIENGVDLPNANTLIVVDSDCLGLSQLYQLKGRIGRGDKQAYAYFTFDGRKVLSENAYKRLEAIRDFTSLGSGFKIAVRDLEIRGAGNVLGAEQHGHMQKVGYAMYIELLKQAISEQKGEKVADFIEVKIETNLPAFIPTEYISKYDQRISTYVAISKLSKNKELEDLLQKLKDFYGEVPVEILNLCKVSMIKNLGSGFNIERIVVKSDIRLIFNSSEDLKNFFERMASKDAFVDLHNKPTIVFNTKENKLDFILSVLQKMFEKIE